MKTRTADFDVAWANRRVRKANYYVTVARRYWNGSAYALATPISINKREIDKLSGLATKFDLPLQNRILPSNVTLTLIDKAYKWLPSNLANGMWRPSGVSPTYGFDPVGSEFVIYYGYELADGTTEYLAMFTGVVEDDPGFDSTSGTVTFSLMEKSASLLESGRAQNVGLSGSGQATSPTDGNGVLLTFSAVLKSVWEITVVAWNAITRTLGSDADYTLDNLNDAELAPDIVFNAGSEPGAFPITFSYRQWYRDKSISELVGYLCDEAGIGSGDRVIEEPIFTGVDQSQSYGSAAEWAAGTLTNADATTLSGYLRRKWYKIDNFPGSTLDAAWSTNSLGYSVSGGKLNVTDGGSAQIAVAKATGTWEIKVAWASGKMDTLISFANGYCLLWRPDPTDSGGGTAQLLKYPSLGAMTGSTSFALTGTDEKTIRITRAATTGETKVYVNGVLKDTATDPDSFSAGYFTLYHAKRDPSFAITYDDIYYSDIVDGSGALVTTDMIWESPEINLLAAPSSWLPLAFAVVLNGGTISARTKSATTSGGAYSAYAATDDTYTPQSPLRQYLKVEITGAAGDILMLAPVFDSFTVNWRGSSLFIKSADFTGLTCLQAVQELAKMGGMEFGSEGDGSFYFRNRNVTGAAEITLSQKNALLAVTKFSTGYKDVRPIATVKYGKSGSDGYYYAEYGAAESGEASPTNEERFGPRTIDLELSRFIFSNDADVANAIAQKQYELFYRPKKKMTVRSRIIPHLSASSRVSISFHDSPLIEKTIFGDPFQVSPPMGANTKTLARSIAMKVVGHTPDIIRGESLIDLEEILS